MSDRLPRPGTPSPRHGEGEAGVGGACPVPTESVSPDVSGEVLCGAPRAVFSQWWQTRGGRRLLWRLLVHNVARLLLGIPLAPRCPEKKSFKDCVSLQTKSECSDLRKALWL